MKAQLQHAVDVDERTHPDDVVLADIWDRVPACEYAGRQPPLTPKQWIEFGKWFSEESPGLSTDMVEYLERFHPTTED